MSLDNEKIVNKIITHVDVNEMDTLLEMEKQRNKGEVWIKLDKNIRNEKLQEFAERYGKDQNMSSKEIKNLKTFFKTCLDKNKLNKAKDVIYNKEDRIIVSIPVLHFNQTTKNYTLKLTDKRVSTLKSLTPKKSEKEELKVIEKKDSN
tara:strand:+ start:386 stop:829 length:444 start_codon:yes stop_codon:yes gene_type:complete